eukprot:gene17413-22962_t
MGQKLASEAKKKEQENNLKNNKTINQNSISKAGSPNQTPIKKETTINTSTTTPSTIPNSNSSGNITQYSSYDSKLSINDFDLLKVLGKGSFGKVMLVKKKDDISMTLYALKTLRKAALVKRNQKDKKFSENRARLYAAEITLALEALHVANIIYRDLKPENILLDADGHLRLTDFGLAKANVSGSGAEGGTKTFCGTPEYLAPEILENKGHGKAVDWWALGTLLFEMITGLPPFYDTNVQRMYHKILHEPLKFPKGDNRQVSDTGRDVLRRFLERRISDRLGSGSTGANEIKRTAFFSILDFDRVNSKQYDPEFKPPASTSTTDVRNFDTEFTSEQAADSMVTTNMSETMQEKSAFQGFTYAGVYRLNWHY